MIFKKNVLKCYINEKRGITMSEPITWENQIDGQDYVFTYQRLNKEHVIKINDKTFSFKFKLIDIFDFERVIDLDGKEAVFIMEGSVPDVALNETFTKSQKLCVKRPQWSWIFVILNALIFPMRFGLIPLALAFFGTAVCVRLSKSRMHVALRIVLCAIITAVAWLLLISIVLG